MTEEELFPAEALERKLNFYRTYEPNFKIFDMRKIETEGPVRNLFFGDSITWGFPLQHFFPNISILNKGIPGDSIWGMYTRLDEDVFRYSPRRVFTMAGINGIAEDENWIVEAFKFLCLKIRARGIEVVHCSMTPLREPDKWDRFQFMDKIQRINSAMKNFALAELDGFVDYYSATVDETGQLGQDCAAPDGTHITIPGYIRMAKVLRPYLLD